MVRVWGGDGIDGRRHSVEWARKWTVGGGHEGFAPRTRMWPQDERGRGWSDTILKGSGLVFQLDCDSLATAWASDRAQLGLRFGGLWKVTCQSSVEVKPAAASRWEVGGPWRGILHFPNI